MANIEHLEIIKQGPAAWNAWREQNPKVVPNLMDADLRDLLLGSEARSAGSSVHAEFESVNFTDASLMGADLSFSYLASADFTGANLRGANLARTALYSVRFERTDLNGANLTGARLLRTIFANIDLRSVQGLETVRHEGPSTVGIDTIYRSKGQIPFPFLRGAGVPENFIAYVAALVGEPIEFYSCFISYSTKDKTFADRLHADLQAKGVRCWFAPHKVSGGKKLHEQIDDAIRFYDRLLLILSEDSMNSEWVKTEIAKARKREVKEKRRMLFPLRLVEFRVLGAWECFDADTGKDSAREIREYFIPDFSNWKDHHCYKEAFERLLRDLKAEDVSLGATDSA